MTFGPTRGLLSVWRLLKTDLMKLLVFATLAAQADWWSNILSNSHQLKKTRYVTSICFRSVSHSACNGSCDKIAWKAAC